MPKDVKTNVVVGVQTRGVKEARRETNAFNKELANGAKEQSKRYVDAQKDLSNLTKEIERSGAVARRVSEQTARAKKQQLAEEERAIRRATRRAEQEMMRSVRQAHRQKEKDDAKRAGAFRQGLAQGGLPLPAPFLQRGPGMGRQLAGMAVGKAISGTVGGVAGAALTGIGGIQQALSGIPILGGAMAGQLGAAASYTQQHIQLQRQRIGMASYLTSPGQLAKSGEFNAARNAAQRERDALQSERDYTEAELTLAPIDTALNERMAGLGKDGRYADQLRRYGARHPGLQTQLAGGNLEKLRQKEKTLAAKLATQDAALAKKDAAISKMPKGAPAAPGLGGLQALGLSLLGVGKAEAEQSAAGIVQAGGGRLQEARQNDIIRTGFAAKTLYGVQEGTSGAFLKGARRGGLVGAQGDAGRAMTEAIQAGLRMGLETSEISDYLNSIAQGIQQFEQTGIPVAKDSIAGMGQAFAVGGAITGTRAMKMGTGLTNYAQTMGQRGIKGGGDLLMLQMLGGYKGGGAKGLQDALINMEQMKGNIKDKFVGNSAWEVSTEDATSDFLRKIIEFSGGGAGGVMGLQKQLSRMGVTLSQGESRILGKRLMGEELDAMDQSVIDLESERRESGYGEALRIGATTRSGKLVGMSGSAAKAVSRLGGSAKAQTAIQNRQLNIGRDMAPAVLSLERAATTTNEAFKDLIKGPLKEFGSFIEGLTKQMSELLTKAKTTGITAKDVVKLFIELGGT